MGTLIVDLAKTRLPQPQKIVMLTEEALCGTKIALGEVLIHKTDGTKIHYIANKRGVLHRGSV